MSKKSTKIAYLVACAVVVVLLVILGVSFKDAPILVEDATTPFAGTVWSLLPPVVAIVLALISKEVYSSLFIGVLVGTLLYTQFNPWNTVVEIAAGDLGIVANADFSIVMFLVLLGIMVDLMNKGGGSAAFGRWATKAVKSRAAAQLMTMVLGILIFIDDYFNCLTVGSVMRPVTESHHISRAKLAYVIDSTAAPVCMLAPVSSWAAAVSGYVEADGVSGIQLFLAQIPYNYYCILTLVMVATLAILNLDYGPMLTHEYNAQVKGDLFTTEERPFAGADEYEEGEAKSSVADLLVPVVVLIATCIIGLIYTGGFFDGETFLDAFANCDASLGLCIGSLIALVFTFVWFWLRGAINFEKSMESVPAGFIQMIAPILILCFAWTLGTLTKSGLGSGVFVENLLADAEGLKNFLPLIVFLIAAVIAFATGTSWGTTGILAPIAVQVFPYEVDPTLCVIGLAAVCAGAVCGDHCSPISDTTIMASAGAHCFHLNHVSTQIPYALTVVAVSAVGFIMAPFIKVWYVCLAVEVALMIVTLLVIKAVVSKKNAGIFAEMAEANKAMTK